MKTYGGTCPLCCGDIETRRSGASAATVCAFCGVPLEDKGMAVVWPLFAPARPAEKRPAWAGAPTDEKVVSLFEPARRRAADEASRHAV